ncbi:MAG: glutamate racemase [Myxococcota bacterium]|nr:glutamate racemase [Myxococcota bacterium]
MSQDDLPEPNLCDLPIGVFDSGVGGLTVARAMRARLPHESIIYLGDTARVPYGNRGADTIRRYALNAAHTLVEQNVKALVIACNTATAHGMDALLETFPDIPVIGVVDPVAREAAARTDTGHIAVTGTRATITSRCYEQALERLLPNVTITSVPCPLFVPLAEEGWTEGHVPEEVARAYLEHLGESSIDTLILGCTHYPLLRTTIATLLDSIMPRHVTLLDSAQATARAVAELLRERNLLREVPEGTEPGDDRAMMRFFVTDEPRGFMGTAVRFFGGPVAKAEHIDITPLAK